MAVRQGDTAMIRTILAVSVFGLVSGSVEHGAASVPLFSTHVAAVPVPPPVVTSSSSQYFERNFNRLVVPHAVVPVAPAPPVFHVAPSPPVIPAPPFAPAPPIFVQPTANAPVTPMHNEPIQPNIAIAVATAQAAPVATFLFPPYPFGVPHNIGFIPPTPTNIAPDNSRKETTTPTTTQTIEETTTKQIETTTPLTASNSDNSFVQAAPSNQNTNFNSYGPPRPQWPQQQPQTPQPQWTKRRPQWMQQQRPQWTQQQMPQWTQQQRPQWTQQQMPQWTQQQRPQWTQQQRPQLPQWPEQKPRQKPLKLKTSVEIVPVPLVYIAPPPLQKYQAVKSVEHIHTFVPTKAKLIIRPIHVSSPIKIRSVRVPSKLVYKLPITARGGPPRSVGREIEPVTFRPSALPVTKPPRL